MAIRRRKSRRKIKSLSQRSWPMRLLIKHKKRLLILFSLFVVVSVPYVYYLDYTIRHQFEGKRWAIPAKVYARPLEMFPEMSLNADQFEDELKILAYRESAAVDAPGSYNRKRDHFLVYTRSFSFWDSSEPALRIRLDFAGQRLLSLRHADSGTSLPLVRLDPGIIARIYPSHNEDRILVKLQEVPQLLVDALTIVEDRDFFHHHGVSIKSIARAMVANLRAGGTVQGGSTLTQQLVKNFFLSNERSLWRKLNEAVMALLLEWHYDKNQILEAYINEIYLGQDGRRAIHGFGLASQFYFEKPLSQLSPAQISLLVAIVKGASYYAPRRHPERALERRNLVLDLLVEQGVMSKDVAEREKHEDLGVTALARSSVSNYPAYLDLVRRQLRRDYKEDDLSSEGLQIFTSMDPMIQRTTEEAFTRRLNQLGKTKDRPDSEVQGAGIIVSVDGGEVLAVVGGRDPQFAGFDRALDAVRHIGSLVKPAVYLTAISHYDKFTLATLLDDSEFKIDMPNGDVWEPQNFDKKSHGMVPLYLAMANSYNQSTARLGMEIGVDNVVSTLHKLGIQRDLNPFPSLLLGATALSPLEVTQMYHTLASGGFRTPLRSIRAVLTADGHPLTRYPLSVEKVFTDDEMYLIQAIMKEVAKSGTARAVYQFVPPDSGIAGKTGTSNDLRDSWFAGFSSDKLGVIWVGMDDNSSVGLTGSAGALRVWGDIMHTIGVAPKLDIMPENVAMYPIDTETYRLANSGCADIVELPFIKGSQPPLAPCAGGDPVADAASGESGDNSQATKKSWFKGLFQ